MSLSKIEMLAYGGIFVGLIGSASISGVAINNLLKPARSSNPASNRAFEIEGEISQLKVRDGYAVADIEKISNSLQHYQDLIKEYESLIDLPDVRTGLYQMEEKIRFNRNLMAGGFSALFASLFSFMYYSVYRKIQKKSGSSEQKPEINPIGTGGGPMYCG